jgi:hypothetical protein
LKEKKAAVEAAARKDKEIEDLKKKEAEREKQHQAQQKQDKLNMAKQMLGYMDISMVMTITGLSREEIEGVAKSN